GAITAWIVVRGIAREVGHLRARAGAARRRRGWWRRRFAIVAQRLAGGGANAGALACEVDRGRARGGVVVGVGDVRRAVGRINRDLEEVEQRAVACGSAQVAIQA